MNDLVVVSVYEQLLLNVKNQLLKSKRSNAELSGKLHQMFQDNLADYEKFERWYSEKHAPFNITEKYKFEHYMIENYKKTIYGGDYAIKEYQSIYS